MEHVKRVIGTQSQKSIIKLYSEFVSKPKADFYTNLGLGFVQGERKGIRIKTLEGIDDGQPPIELIDCRTSGGVFNLGHNHPDMIKALKEGLEAGLDIGDHIILSEQRALLAKKLADLLPGDIQKTQFCTGGGEAIDLAIKLARGYTKRKKIISAKRAYHGVTGFALGACASNFKDPFQWNLPDFVQVPFGEIDSIKKVIDNETACVILETIPATGGILIAQEGYFSAVRELCEEKGVMMIADEVQTGLGRTGYEWCIYGGLYEEEKVIPDMIVLGKGMTAGIYPLATVSYRPFIEEVFDEDPFLHVSSTGGSEIGCYVCSKMLDIIFHPSFLENVKIMGQKFGMGLNDLKEKYHELIAETRGRGLMWGIELADEFTSLAFTLSMIKNGLLADYCQNHKVTNKLMPPLIVKEGDIEEILERLDRALKEIS
ncbi:MAG: class-III pyridoxal-phosphate-dependent aminotransferase [Candidatus Hodarchaeales archaeon]|jgi:acetylornithine/succinyldiaminopimelate/putrescine aminotransferase